MGRNTATKLPWAVHPHRAPSPAILWHSYRLWNIILSVYFFLFFFYNKCIQWLGRQVWEKIKDGLVCLKQFQSFVSFLYRWNRTAALNPGRLGGQKIVVTRLPSQSRKLMSLYSKSVLCITILIAHFWSSRAMWFPRLSIWQQRESCWWKWFLLGLVGALQKWTCSYVDTVIRNQCCKSFALRSSCVQSQILRGRNIFPRLWRKSPGSQRDLELGTSARSLYFHLKSYTFVSLSMYSLGVGGVAPTLWAESGKQMSLFHPFCSLF